MSNLPAVSKTQKYKVIGDAKRKYGVALQNGAVEYDLLETRAEAVAIKNILNRGIGPEWDAVSKALVADQKTRQWAEHTQDSDCTVDPNTDCCTVCGVHHGDPCSRCNGRGFHKADCLHIQLCWVCEENYAVTTHESKPICEACLDHFTAPSIRRGDYTDSATANDMRFGCDSDFGGDQ